MDSGACLVTEPRPRREWRTTEWNRMEVLRGSLRRAGLACCARRWTSMAAPKQPDLLSDTYM